MICGTIKKNCICTSCENASCKSTICSTCSINHTYCKDYINSSLNKNFEYEETKGGICLVSYIGDDEEVIIPSFIDGKKILKINSLCFCGNDNVKSIYFPENIILENHCVVDLNNLENIYLGDVKKASNFISDCIDVDINCTSKTFSKIKKIYNDDSIRLSYDYSFEFEKGVDGNYTIINFNPSLINTDVIIPSYYNGIKVTKIASYTFPRKKITSITFNEFIEEIPDGSFEGCTLLEKVNNIQNIKRIGYKAFYSCKNLNIDFKEFKSLIEVASFAFGKTGIKKFEPIVSFKLNQDLFFDSALEEVDLSNVNLEEIGKLAFDNCRKLKKVKLSRSTKVLNDSAFYYCRNLSSIDNVENLEVIKYNCFDACRNLFFDFEKARNLQTIGDRAFYRAGIFKFKPSNNLKEIGEYAFAFSFVEEVDLSDYDSKIFFGMFCYCNNLFKVNFGKVKDILDSAFMGCSKLKEVQNTESIENVGNSCFRYCKRLFFDCSFENIKKIGIASFSEVKLREEIFLKNTKLLRSSFYKTRGLNTVHFEGKRQIIPTECFFDSSVRKVILSKSIKKIENEAFLYSKLEEINLENVEEVGQEAFMETRIKEIKLEKAKKLEKRAFGSCKKLKKVNLEGSPIISIDKLAFIDCDIKEFEPKGLI